VSIIRIGWDLIEQGDRRLAAGAILSAAFRTGRTLD
jgi:hypothetical protein